MNIKACRRTPETADRQQDVPDKLKTRQSETSFIGTLNCPVKLTQARFYRKIHGKSFGSVPLEKFQRHITVGA